MVKYQHRDNSICIIKSDAGKEWRMMKKVDKKKIILSVLLSSMLWSNSLYAYELSENVLSGDIGQNELENDKSFEKVIVATGFFFIKPFFLSQSLSVLLKNDSISHAHGL